jgi:Nucleoside recognition
MEVFLRTFVTGSFDLLLRVFLIVVPIMVVLELFEGTRAFSAVVRAWARVVRHIGLDERSAAPTLVGFLFGLAYGGGVIVRDVRRHDLGRRQVFIMSVFLSMVHAIVEDSLIFIALGAGILWVVVYRVVWAALVTLALTALAGVWVRRHRRRANGRLDG